MRIGVVGTGYVGLVVGTCLAETGNDVICVDTDAEKLRLLSEGVSPIYEPGLQELLRKNLKEKRLRFTGDLEEAVDHSRVIFLCLPTPSASDGSAELQAVVSVARGIGKRMKGYKVIVNKSTVPVGTAELVRSIMQEETTEEFDVVSSPEFMKEGAAVNDFMKPDRIVIGTTSDRAMEIMKDLSMPFVRTGNPVIEMDERSAEVCKYAANAFLATKISFINELANFCEKVDADIESVRRGIRNDPRIGAHFLFAGVGYGGSCFPKDVRALLSLPVDADFSFDILGAVERVNNKQRLRFVDKIRGHYGKGLSDALIAIWGLSFKPNTDDVREAPALTIITELLKQGARIAVHDPVAMEQARKLLGEKVAYCENNYDTLRGANGLVVCTEWNEFRNPDFEKMKSLMQTPVVFDGRNIYKPSQLRSAGFVYYGIGRKSDAH